jgi:hypothetical protein
MTPARTPRQTPDRDLRRVAARASEPGAVSGPDRLTRLAAMLRARRFDETLIANAELVSGVFHVSIAGSAPAEPALTTRWRPAAWPARTPRRA